MHSNTLEGCVSTIKAQDKLFYVARQRSLTVRHCGSVSENFAKSLWVIIYRLGLFAEEVGIDLVHCCEVVHAREEYVDLNTIVDTASSGFKDS